MCVRFFLIASGLPRILNNSVAEGKANEIRRRIEIKLRQ